MPCSWYLEAGEIVPYEFAEKVAWEDVERIRENLRRLEKKGYQCYGVTIRPIENVVEIETK